MNHLELLSDQACITLKRRILSLKGLCIGFIVGLTAVGFRLSLEYAEKLRNTFLAFSRSHEFYYWPLPALLLGLFIAIVVFVTLKFSPDAGGSGIPHLKGYLEGLLAFRAWSILFV